MLPALLAFAAHLIQAEVFEEGKRRLWSLNWPYDPRESFLSLSLPTCKMGWQYMSQGAKKEPSKSRGPGRSSGPPLGCHFLLSGRAAPP